MSVYIVTARSGGVPAAGLSPVWDTLRRVSDGTSVSSPATAAPVTALGGGGYKIVYDPTAGELYGVLNFGSGLSDPNERYADVYLTADPALLAATNTAIVNATPLDTSALATAAGLSTLQTAVSGVQTSVSGVQTSVAAVVSAVAALPAAELGAAIITIPGDHTTSGNPVTLTHKQVIALEDAVRGGDNTTGGTPAANATVTVTYYLRGQPKTTGNVAQVSTVTYGAGGQQTGRVDKVASPFPSF